MIDSYITVSKSSREEIVINKSRFIGYACPCSAESEALAFLKKIREEHKSATHHCYAYIIGENSGIMRYSDDGEPGGTAGLPIVEAMRTKTIVNCCIVVVRYFGGVLLGTGGLVRAYTQSAQAALHSAGIAKMELTCVVQCEVPYSVWDKIHYASERLPVRIENINFGASIGFQLLFRSSDRDTVLPKISDAAERKMRTDEAEEIFAAWCIE